MDRFNVPLRVEILGWAVGTTLSILALFMGVLA
jgi:hypothetical protein